MGSSYKKICEICGGTTRQILWAQRRGKWYMVCGKCKRADCASTCDKCQRSALGKSFRSKCLLYKALKGGMR